MTQSVLVQVGQCGNQIGWRFWDLALKELELNTEANIHMENAFFKIQSPSNSIKARALLVDMEEGVISEMLRSPLKKLFDANQIVTDVSGSGNNWAVGHTYHGDIYQEKIENLIRKEVEISDNLQSFFLLHSIGGGTGSGLGTKILELLNTAYPKKQKFVVPVYPSSCDDVITSPYNAILANDVLIQHADCVIPVENEALQHMCEYSSKRIRISSAKSRICRNREKPFDFINDIIADLLLNITCFSRLPGALNIDLGELVTNMIPYPTLHFLVSSTTPLISEMQNIPVIRVSDMFTDLFSSHHQLFNCEIRKGIFSACALLTRGQINLSDVQDNIDRLRKELKFVSWNEWGWKTGICKSKPIDYSYSALMLCNNTYIWNSFLSLKNKFLKMYTRKAHLHHFLEVQNFEIQTFEEVLDRLNQLIHQYKEIENFNQMTNENKSRLKPFI